MKYSLYVDFPFGRVLITSNDTVIQRITFVGTKKKLIPFKNYPAVLLEAKLQIEKYFNGVLHQFSLPLDETLGTPFQKKVWSALQKIPYGETWSYLDVAHSIGQEKSCRAVGMANNRNPFVLVVPCHRVINKNGELGGFGSGVDLKSWLLFQEKAFLSGG